MVVNFACSLNKTPHPKTPRPLLCVPWHEKARRTSSPPLPPPTEAKKLEKKDGLWVRPRHRSIHRFIDPFAAERERKTEKTDHGETINGRTDERMN